MYLAVLYTHSWLRYLVLALGLWLLVTSFRAWRAGASWSESLEKAHVRFLAVLDTQLLLGLSLYFVLSPIAGAALSNLRAAMPDPTLRFYGVEHIATMLIAVIVAHVGRVRSKKKSGSARCKSAFVTQLTWVVLTLAAIPWPGLDIARPLFRF